MSASTGSKLGFAACLFVTSGAITLSVFLRALEYSSPLKTKRLTIAETNVTIDVKGVRRPPPIGAAFYPAGEALLAIVEHDMYGKRDGGIARRPAPSPSPSSSSSSSTFKSPKCHVVEIGSGTGLFAIAAAAHGLRVTGSDNDPSTLSLLLSNAASNAETIKSVPGGSLTVLDLSYVSQTPAEWIPLSCTHLVAGDVIYHSPGSAGEDYVPAETPSLEALLEAVQSRRVVGAGGRDDASASASASAVASAAAADTAPRVELTLVLSNRFAGSVVRTMASLAGASIETADTNGGVGLDPSLVRFERKCRERGVELVKEGISDHVYDMIWERLDWGERIQWTFFGIRDSLIIYRFKGKKDGVQKD